MSNLLDNGYDLSDDEDQKPVNQPPKVEEKPVQKETLVVESPEADDSDEEPSSQDEEEDDDGIGFPTETLMLPCHENAAITSAGISVRGNRFATGDLQGVVRVWDFHNMDLSCSRFKEYRTPEHHMIQACQFSLTGSHILISSGERYAQITDSTLSPVIITYKGDMYVRDLTHTPGHTHAIYDAQWHPSELNLFATGALDGTVRIFDLESKPQGLDQALASTICLKTLDKRNSNISRETGVHALRWIQSDSIVAGCADDSVQIWDTRSLQGKSRKPRHIVRGLHHGEAVQKVCVSQVRSTHVYTRSANYINCIDLRKPSSAVATLNIPSTHRSNMDLFGFGRYIITGSTSEAQGPHLAVVSTSSMEIIDALVPGTATEIHCVTAHDSLRQIFCGTNGGSVVSFFDPNGPQEGAAAIRQVGRKMTENEPVSENGELVDSAYSWYNLPSNIKCLNDGTLKEIKPKRHQLRAERNPVIPQSFRLPNEEPILKKTMAQTVMKSFLDSEAAQTGENLGSYEWVDKIRTGESAGSRKYGNVSLVDRAYKRSQPEPVLDTSSEVGTGEALLTGERKCPQCGLKMCTCGYMSLMCGRRLEVSKKSKKN